MPFCPQCKYEYVSGAIVCPDCDAKLVESLPKDEPSLAEPECKLVTVYTTSDGMEAEMLKSFLESSGVACFLKNLHFGSLSPRVPVLGEIELQVAADFAEKARQALEDLRGS